MKEFIIFALVFILTFCGCGAQTTMDLELLQEEAFQKGYEQGLVDSGTRKLAEDNYDSGYSIGYEEGYAAGYSDGMTVSKDNAEETPEQAESISQTDDTVYHYVLNMNSMKFHKPECESVSDIKESNKDYFTGTRSEITAKGYEPCKRCNP